MQPGMDKLQDKLFDAIAILREAVDLSAEIKSQGPTSNQQVARLWETFLAEFFGYIRQRSKETKQNLLAGIAFPRIR